MVVAYDGVLTMPSRYAVMEEKEMIYVEGGDNVYRMELNAAKSYFEGVTGMAIAFAAASYAIPRAALKAIGSNYYIYLAGSAANCANQCKEWLKKYKPSKTTKVTEYKKFGIITGYGVNL